MGRIAATVEQGAAGILEHEIPRALLVDAGKAIRALARTEIIGHVAFEQGDAGGQIVGAAGAAVREGGHEVGGCGRRV